jgi:hypothetical protein
MNEAQRQSIKNRQRAAVRDMVASEPAEGAVPAEAPPPKRTTDEIVVELVERNRPPVADGMPVSFIRFSDKTMQVPGMQSGEQLEGWKAQANGRRHTIEFVRELNCFLIGYIDPDRGKAEYVMVERSAVRSWKLAAPPS